MQHIHPSEEHVKVLNEVFRLKNFKNDQWKVIRSIMYDKRDTAIVASTGFGKSLTFQFPPVFLNKISIVISPLISLCHDQVHSLLERGIKSTYFNSTQSDRNIPLRFHEYSVIYLTPDALLNPPENFAGSALVQRNVHRIIDKVCMFAIDEAHVVSQWSDFRPIMNDLYKIREKFCLEKDIPILTLTATCPMYVEIKINNILRLIDPFRLRTTLNRPNLYFEVRRKTMSFCGEENAMHDLLPILKEQKDGCTIIYVIRVDDSNNISEQLNKQGIKCKPYNSKLKKKDKETTLKSFRSGELKTVVCTIAFGMGIDRADVRAVLHYGMPRTLEGYYQEAGRAGRDGKKSRCIMFHSGADIQAHNFLIDHPTENVRNPQPVSEETKLEQKRLLQKTIDFVHSKMCRRVELLRYLEAEQTEYGNLIISPECCDNCKRVLAGGGVNIPPKLLYEGILDDGTIDCTTNLRLLLESIRDANDSSTDALNILQGEIPTENFGVGLKYFGSGKMYSRHYWAALLTMAMSKGYTEVDNTLSMKAKWFLRNRLKREYVVPVLAMLQTMQKRNNLIFYWDNNEIKSRPKTQDEIISDKYGIPVSIQQSLTKEESNQLELLLGDDDMMDVEDESEIIQKTMQGLTEHDFVDLTKDNEDEIVTQTMSGLTEDDFIDLTGEEDDLIVKQTMSGITMEDFIDVESDNEQGTSSKKQRLQ